MTNPSSESGSAEFLLVYQDALARGKFLIQQCRECGKFVFYPRALCSHCGSPELKWVAPSGRGVVHSAAGQSRPEKTGDDFSIAMIELEEGPRLLGRVMDVEPGKLTVGMQVSAHVGLVDGRHEVVFYNKEQGSKEW